AADASSILKIFRLVLTQPSKRFVSVWSGEPSGHLCEMLQELAMTEAEWLACTDPQLLASDMHLRGRERNGRKPSSPHAREDWGLSERKRRLYAIACCRLVWDLIPDEQLRCTVEVTERYADGRASEQEFQAATINQPEFGPAAASRRLAFAALR